MPFSTFLNHATKHRRAGMLFALVAVLSLVLLSACAAGSDVEAADDSARASESTSTADETAGSDETAEPDAQFQTRAPADARGDDRSDDTRGDDRSDDNGVEGKAEPGRAGGSSAGTALAMLDELEVKGRAPKSGYDADLFKWRSDADHNGCDTRNDVLRRDLADITLKAGSKGCVVIAGDLNDQYKGETYAFDRTPNNIDIDHIVARSNAWQTGAATLDEDTLKEFGNDPLNLLAVSSNLNRQKGDGDAATWLPPAKSYRCEYVSRQIAIKHKYELWVVKAEKSAMQRVLGSCKEERAFTQAVAWPEPGEGDNVTTQKEKSKKKANSTKAKPSSSGSGAVYFKNCTAARDAGAVPVRRGDAGYASHLDRDGDGVGCE